MKDQKINWLEHRIN